MVTFRAGGRSWTTRAEVAPIFRHFIDEIARRGYSVSEGQLDDWSYVCRAIAGTKIASNHSWGLAVDINSLANPMTFNGKLITDMPPWVVECAAAHGLGWGGYYTGGKKDAMHYEWLGSMHDAELMVLHLAGISGGETGGQQEDDDMPPLTPQQWTEFQQRLVSIERIVQFVGEQCTANRGDRMAGRILEIRQITERLESMAKVMGTQLLYVHDQITPNRGDEMGGRVLETRDIVGRGEASLKRIEDNQKK